MIRLQWGLLYDLVHVGFRGLELVLDDVILDADSVVFADG